MGVLTNAKLDLVVDPRHDPARAIEDDDEPGQEALDPAVGYRRLVRYLAPQRRELLGLLASRSMSHRQAAEIVGVSPGTISRQLARLRRNLDDPLVRAIAIAPDEVAEADRALVVAHLLGGESINQLAAASRVNAREVSARLNRLRGWSRAVLARHANT
jgi:DNA-directed RNA polymerase specialized sigma24 family protein